MDTELVTQDIRPKRIFGTRPRLFWKQRYLQIMILIAIVLLIIYHYIPMFGIIISFNNYNISKGIIGMFTSPWVGLKFFKEFLTEYNFPILLRNTLGLSILKMIFIFPVPIFLAVVINELKARKFKRLVQTASYLPNFISWIIVVGFIGIFFNQQSGVVNDLMVWLGIFDKPQPILTKPQYFWPLAIVTDIWKNAGWWAIIFLAAISSQDPTLYEAAEIDGASRLKRIWHITMPGIQPTITIVLILALGGLLGGGLTGSNFEQCYLLGNEANAKMSEIVATYTLRVGLGQGRYSYASAVGLLQSFISLFLVLGSNFAAKKVTGEGLF